MSAQYFPFDPNPRKPSAAPPSLSCDAQFHVLGPEDRYPPRPGAAYIMPSATWQAAKRMHDALGIQRGIIVQPTTYGADHQVTLDGLAALGPGYKACANAAVFAASDDAYLAKLHAAGVRGARFTRQGLGLALSKEDYAGAIAKVIRLGWYAKFQPEPGGIIEQLWMLDGLEIPAIIDHMGRPDPVAGAADPTLRKVTELLRRGNFWVMLSLGEKISKSGPPWDDVIPIARTYLEAAPDRVIWASDWPHPVSAKQPPNEADLLELLYRIAPDAATRRKILVDNPAILFGFQ
ncbi:MAG: 2-pyrone-4,6-dicarboxylate hydrolase [Betaproteobacteria bacterium]|nr:2-pyrone-4,6-dicarboxylate hydrolase [Betaproteobacteria bacterium]